MKEKLRTKLEMLNLKLKSTVTDQNQFKINTKSDFMINILKNNLTNVKSKEAWVGKEVYPVIDSFNYGIVPVLEGSLNGTEEKPVKFTEKLFKEWKVKILQYKIGYFIKDLVVLPIVQNSTDPFVNLVFGWHLECKQELIGFYKNLLHDETIKSK